MHTGIWWGNLRERDQFGDPGVDGMIILSFIFLDGGHVALVCDRRDVYMVLVGKPEEKRPLGSPRRRWEGNIKMDFQEVGCGGMDWIELAQDDRWRALVSAVMKLRVP